MNMINVYRFRERVAISLPGNCETVYISPEAAKSLALALQQCSADFVHSFVESQFAPIEIAAAK